MPPVEDPTTPPPEVVVVSQLGSVDLETAPERRFGWVPDVPDVRDKLFKVTGAADAPLPSKVDLRELCPPVLDQKSIGSCVSQALANDHLFAQKRFGTLSPELSSRLFIYYNARAMIGTVDSDSGASVRDSIKSLATQGACKESLWPYSDKRRAFPNFLSKPDDKCYEEALDHRISEYRRIINLRGIKECLAQGDPIVAGFSVYSGFMSEKVARTGMMEMPNSNENLLGGHAILICGYFDEESKLLIMNSWGESWGIKGYFLMPYAMVLDGLVDDIWTISRVI